MLLRTGPRLFVAALAACTLAVITFALPAPQDIGTWQLLGSLAAVRSGGAAALLDDGTVLVAGGRDASGALASAEAVDASGASTPVANLNVARADHTATTLKDGRVLVTGGTASDGTPLASAEIFTPGSGWAPIAMHDARAHHTATRLDDGRVLIAGGDQAGAPVASIEIFDPATNAFTTFGAALTTARTRHTAAMLPTNRVLIAGGFDGTNALASTEIVNIVDGVVVAGPSLTTPRMNFTATRLLDADILLAGGTDGTNDLASADLYTVLTGDIAGTTALGGPRQGHLALLLPNNNGVLIAGGTAAGQPLPQSEIFLPQSRFFQATGNTLVGHVAAVGSGTKTDGVALAAGGSGTAAIEGYHFATVKTDKDDYAPGTVVTITGSGWVPGETVTLSLDEQPDFDSHPDMTATVQPDGTFVNTDFSPDEHDLNIRFTLTARGSVSEAQNTFTDSIGFSGVSVLGAQSPDPVAQGGTAQYGSGASSSVSVTFFQQPPGGGSCTVTLSVSAGLPSGATASFSPATLTSGSAGSLVSLFSVVTISSTPTGSFPLTIQAKGTGGNCNGDVHTTAATLNVSAANISTATAVISTPNPSVVAQSVTFTANVAAASGSTAPTGTVQFVIDGSNSGAPVTLAACAPPATAHACATLSTSSLTAGPHTVSASYTHTGPFTDSSGALAGGQQVNTRSTTTSVAVSPTTVLIGETSTATVTVTDTEANGTASHPAGTVTVSSSIGTDTFSPVSQQCTLAPAVAANQSTCTVDITPAADGTHNISASYTAAVAPSVHSDSSSASPAVLTVNKRSTSTALALSPTSVVVGEDSTATVTVTDTGAAGTKQHPSGTVSVTSSDATDSVTGTCTLSPTATDGESTCTTTITPTELGSGPRTITATFSATAVHTGSSTTQPLTVALRTTSTSVALSPASVVVGQASTATITVTDTSGSGAKSNPGVGTVVTMGSDSGDTIAGTCTLAALSTDKSQCSVTVTPNGFGTGTHKITASFTATTVHDTSSGSADLTVTRRTSSTAVSLTPSSVVAGQTSTASVTVTDTESAGTKQFPTGVVSVTSSVATDVITGTCTLSNSGTDGASTCSVSVKPTHVDSGSHTITATFTQSDVHSGSHGDAPLSVSPASTLTTITTNLSPHTVTGQSYDVAFTVTVQAPGSGTPTGSVTVSDGSQTCTASVAIGQCALTSTTAGTKTVTATYAGDSDFLTSTSSGVTHVVDKADTTTTITADTPDPSLLGQIFTVSWSVTVNTPGSGTPTGTVTVDDGAGASCTAAVSSGSCSLASTTAGAKTLTATYSGDPNFVGSADTEAHQVNFGFAGLFDPYGPPPRSYKVNSSIPLKWQYTDNSGVPVDSASAAPQVLIVGLGACGDTSGDPIVVDDAGQSGYQYDPISKMWQFNWKTKGLGAGCFGVTIKSGQTGQMNPPPGSFFVVQLKK